MFFWHIVSRTHTKFLQPRKQNLTLHKLKQFVNLHQPTQMYILPECKMSSRTNNNQNVTSLQCFFACKKCLFSVDIISLRTRHNWHVKLVFLRVFRVLESSLIRLRKSSWTWALNLHPEFPLVKTGRYKTIVAHFYV